MTASKNYGSDPVQALHAIAGLSAAEAVSFLYLVVQQLGMPLPVSFGGQRNHPEAPMSCDVATTHDFVTSWARLPMRSVFTLIELFKTYGCLHARQNKHCEQQAAHGRPTHTGPCICAWCRRFRRHAGQTKFAISAAGLSSNDCRYGNSFVAMSMH